MPSQIRAALAATVLTAALAGAAVAQTPAAQPPAGQAPASQLPLGQTVLGTQQPLKPVATDASRAEAKLLGEKLGWEPQVRGIINTVRTQIIVSLAQVNGKTPQEMLGPVDDVLMPDFVGEAGNLTGTIVEAWAEMFTPEELHNLRDFYNTPLGDKLLHAIPQLNARIAQAGQTWAQKIYQQAQQKHADDFTKRGLRFNP
jgi:uncharacterized protein